jgi:predicted DNA binding CopG/RHH family protein
VNPDDMNDTEMAEEARRWAEGELPSEPLVEAPDAVPRTKETEAISLRLPKKMLAILKEFARRQGIGYQVLMKRWLNERIGEERKAICMIYPITPEVHRRAAAFDPRLANELSDNAGRDPFGLLAEKVAAKE